VYGDLIPQNYDLELRCALRGGCLDLTTFSLHILDIVALHQRVLDISFVLRNRMGMGWMDIWSGVWVTERGLSVADFFLIFFSAHNDLLLDLRPVHPGLMKNIWAAVFSARHPKICN
jgi:hypothetical protein